LKPPAENPDGDEHKAGIPFDIMAYPMRQHGIEDRPASIHLFEKMLEFWKERL